MKLLVVGSGGREHALAWKLAQSDRVERVYLAPGNGGTALERKCRNLVLPVDAASGTEYHTALVAAVQQEGIALTIVGPEQPLAEGIVDAFRAEGLAIVGPDARGARLESSKAFSKDFMAAYGIRAAKSTTFHSYSEARAAVVRHFAEASRGDRKPAPLVVKADGLAAGKGVVVAQNFTEADGALKDFMVQGTLGASGQTVVLEDFLSGVEVSILAAVSTPAVSTPAGTQATILPFIPARDHKRRFEGGHGPNTGGMGAIAPVPDFSEAAQADFRTAILEPTLRGIVAEGMDYRGFIFFGLMVDGDRCSLLEYNVRLGDPETQAVLPLMESDLSELCGAILDGSLANFPLAWKKGSVCAPVAVAQGYPGSYRKGDPISVDAAAVQAAGAQVFFAGAVLDGDGLACNLGPGATEAGVLRTAGGRVLAVSAHGDNGEEARNKAYAAMEGIGFDGMGYRRDIGVET